MVGFRVECLGAWGSGFIRLGVTNKLAQVVGIEAGKG